jgi:hypothetical protein
VFIKYARPRAPCRCLFDEQQHAAKCRGHTCDQAIFFFGMVHLAGAGAMGSRLAARLVYLANCAHGAALLYRRLSLRCSWWRPPRRQWRLPWRPRNQRRRRACTISCRNGNKAGRGFGSTPLQRPCRALCAFISTGDTLIMDSVWCSVGYERICKGSLEAHEVSAGHKAAVGIVKTR